MPNKSKIAWVDQADPTCSRETMKSKTTRGKGTNPKRNNSGNASDCEDKGPKQKTKIPIHDRTNATIQIVSWLSLVIAWDKRTGIKAIAIAVRRIAGPLQRPQSAVLCASRRFFAINAALTGRTSAMCVNSSLYQDNDSVMKRERHATSTDVARRNRNTI